MKNLMRKMGKVFAVVLCVMLLVACGSKKEEVDQTVVHGTWVRVWSDGVSTTTYTINADGTYKETAYAGGDFPVSMSDEGTYTYDGEKIVLVSSFDVEVEYKVSFDGNDMIWSNDKTDLRYQKY